MLHADVLLVREPDTCFYQVTEGTVLWLRVRGPYVAGLLSHYFGSGRRRRRLVACEGVEVCFEEALALSAEAGQRARVLASLRCLELIALLGFHEQERKRGRREQLGVLRCQQKLLKDPARRLNLSREAKSLGQSVASFRRHFHAIQGQTPLQYGIQLRLESARKQLEEGKLSLGAISRGLGFSSLSYFSRLFRRRYACSPRAWRLRGPE